MPISIRRTSPSRLRLQVWNLSGTPKKGAVKASGVRLAGLPPVVDLPAWGKAELAVTLAPERADAYRAQAVFTGTFNGKRTSRLSIPLRLEQNILANCRVVPLARANDPKAWARNDSAAEYKVAWDEAEQAVRFDVSWVKKPGVDRWFYPVFELKLPEEDLSDAAMFEFEIKTEQNKVENDFACQHLMLLFSDTRADRFLTYLPPLNTWETRRVELSTEVGNAGPVRAFRLGANPKGTTLAFWIRNFKILKLK